MGIIDDLIKEKDYKIMGLIGEVAKLHIEREVLQKQNLALSDVAHNNLKETKLLIARVNRDKESVIKVLREIVFSVNGHAARQLANGLLKEMQRHDKARKQGE